MSSYLVYTDSGADLPQEMYARYDIRIVPMDYLLNGESITFDTKAPDHNEHCDALYAAQKNNADVHTSQITGSRVFESCTFADNVGTGWMSIENNTTGASITFRNNVWVGNRTTAGALMPIGAGGWLLASNCVVDGESHTTGTYTDVTTTDDPGLKRDYSPRSGSPCIDKGLHQSWMDTAVDLDGNPRILYKAVDIGAFERRQTGTIIQLR